MLVQTLWHAMTAARLCFALLTVSAGLARTQLVIHLLCAGKLAPKTHYSMITDVILPYKAFMQHA